MPFLPFLVFPSHMEETSTWIEGEWKVTLATLCENKVCIEN